MWCDSGGPDRGSPQRGRQRSRRHTADAGDRPRACPGRRLPTTAARTCHRLTAARRHSVAPGSRSWSKRTCAPPAPAWC